MHVGLHLHLQGGHVCRGQVMVPRRRYRMPIAELGGDIRSLQYVCPRLNHPLPDFRLADTVSDAILVALPFRLLWRVKLPSNQRIMVLSVFSTSVLVSIISAVHTAYLIPLVTFVGGATAEMEVRTLPSLCRSPHTFSTHPTMESRL